MPADVETMAYTGAVPWHGLGVEVRGDMSPAEMLRAAQLEWEVRKVPLQGHLVSDPTTTGRFINEHFDFHSHFCLGRFDGPKFRDSLGICGKAYVPTQNAQAFQFFKEFTDAGEMTMETAGSLQGGKFVWALARVGEGFELPGGDLVKGHLLLMSPHIWGKCLVIMQCATRVVCMNTLLAALGEGCERFRAPHIREFNHEVAEEAKKALGIATRSMEHTREQFELLASSKVSLNTQVKFVAELFQPKLLVETVGSLSGKDLIKSMLNDKMRIDPAQLRGAAADVLSYINSSPGADLASAKETFFGLLNGVTYYIDHKAGRSRDNALTSAWLGTGSRIKRAALANAVAYARAVRK